MKRPHVYQAHLIFTSCLVNVPYVRIRLYERGCLFKLRENNEKERK